MISRLARKRPHLIDKYILKGYNPNFRNELGYCAIHYACHKNNVEAVKVLLKHGANCNVRNKKGNTPLHYTNSLEIILLLLDNGANPFTENQKGKRPDFYKTGIAKDILLNSITEKSKEECRRVAAYFKTNTVKLIVCRHLFPLLTEADIADCIL